MLSPLESRRAMKVRRTMPVPQRPGEELSLDDDDIIDAAPIAPSGTFVAVRSPAPARDMREVETLPPPPEPEEERGGAPAKRVDLAEDELPTDRIDVSDVIADLARLSDPMSVPRIRGAIDRASLDQAETWLLTLVEARFSVRAILAMGPMNDEAALGLLAQMILERKISLAPVESFDDVGAVVDDAWD